MKRLPVRDYFSILDIWHILSHSLLYICTNPGPSYLQLTRSHVLEMPGCPPMGLLCISVTPLGLSCVMRLSFLSILLICVLPARLPASTRLLRPLLLILILSSYSLDASFIHTFLSWPHFPRVSKPLTIHVPSSIMCTRESFLQL